MNIKDNIKQRISELDQKRCKLLDQLETFDDDQLAHKPKPDDWSTLAIAEHLAFSERFMLEDLPEPSSLTPKNQPLKAALMYPLATFILNRNIKVTPPPNLAPKGDIPLADIRAQWDQNQDWLKKFVTVQDEHSLQKPLINHPVMGPLPTLRLMNFIHTHFDYHNRQIQQRATSPRATTE